MSSKDPTSDYNAALALKDAGNQAFKLADYKLALKNYSRIFMHIGMNPCMNMQQMMGGAGKSNPAASSNKDPLQQKTDLLRLTAFNNMAAVYAKQGKWDDVKEKCTRVLKHDDKNTKALFRRGMAYRKCNLYELARVDLENAKKILNTNDPAINREIKLLDKDEKNADKEFMKAMKKKMQKAQKIKKKKKEKKNQEKAAKKKLIQDEKNKDKNPNITINKKDEDDDSFMWDVPQKDEENKNKNNQNNQNNNNKEKIIENSNNKPQKIENNQNQTNKDNINKNNQNSKTKKEEQPSEF